jgi:hypothetical protein
MKRFSTLRFGRRDGLKATYTLMSRASVRLLVECAVFQFPVGA